jgi:hypothetical protein
MADVHWLGRHGRVPRRKTDGGIRGVGAQRGSYMATGPGLRNGGDLGSILPTFGAIVIASIVVFGDDPLARYSWVVWVAVEWGGD